MPLRSLPFPLVTRLSRPFHTSTPCRDGSPYPNHYKTLQIPTNASPSDVKKSFYSLSKTHHPDRNPDDPGASERFVRISEAYAIIGTPAKRQAYDREHIHPHQHDHSHVHSHRPQASYSSSGPAGGRPASGLSRRRTQFRGPPPSFYRSGGWGEHSAKRKAAQENGAPGAKKPPGYDGNGNGSGKAGGVGSGVGRGQTPFGDANDVPHFDREGHFRTHENQRQRWAQRRRLMEEGYIPTGEAPRGTLANLLFVGAIISLGVFIPSFIFEKLTLKKGSGEKKEKS